MNRLQQLEQKVFEHEIEITKLQSAKNVILTPEKIQEFVANGEKYQTNFVKTLTGNGIRTGTELKIKIRGAEIVTGKISYKGALLIIDQSHANDEDKDASTINFKLKHRRYKIFKYNLPLGEYTLHLWFYDQDSGERGTYTDKFEIVA